MTTETFVKACKEFLASPDTFGQEAFADLLCDFANEASEDELTALAMCMVGKKA